MGKGIDVKMRRSLTGMAFLAAVVWMGIGSPSAFAADNVFQDCPQCPEMVVLPAGAVIMGSLGLESTAYASKAERETSSQKIASFAIGRFEITQAQWNVYLKDEPFDERRLCSQWNSKKEQFEDSDVSEVAGLDLPISCVSYSEVQGYLQWLSRKTGRTYRLPSEAEWEYAAKAGSITAYPWGNDPNEACETANVYDQSAADAHSLGYAAIGCKDGFAGVAPVGSMHANGLELFDMIGNVAEWTADCFTESYVGRPNDGRAWVWSGGCTRHVVKGGSFDSPQDLVRPGARDAYDNRARFQTIGFRVATDVPVQNGQRTR
jgi:formylglycine-generating enzyme required for sulfatase activity